MYVLALATDYDETIADEGIVSEATQAALQRLKETGRKLILVTGRELADLERVFPGIEIFDKIVAENGAILYTPASKEQRDLAPSPSPISSRGSRRAASARCRSGAPWSPHWNRTTPSRWS